MEINKDNWKQIDLNVDSLWLIPERERQGKHKNIYHGNFVPQLLKRLRMPEIPCWSCSQAAGLPCSHMKTCANMGVKTKCVKIEDSIKRVKPM